MKKRTFQMVIALLALAISLPLVVADTGQINYQARLLDSYGRRLNTTVNLSFKIYDAATGGNLLWSESHANVTVQDGTYSVALGSQTPIPASVFAQNNVYLELGINSETMTPRQQITASAYSLVARTIMGSNIFENQTSGYVGIGTTNPVVKLDISGTIRSTGFKMTTGAAANYVLVSDTDGAGTWQPISIVITEVDPIHTNWVRTIYTPAANDIWTAINNEATTRANADTALQNNIDTSSNALGTAISDEATTRAADDTTLQNNINTASNALNAAKLNLSGGIMTGTLINNVLFSGNGAGLTNIPDSGLVSTSYVRKTGDIMTGLLTVSNSVIITTTNQAGYFVATSSISLASVVITNWLEAGQTGTVASLMISTNALNTRAGTLETSTNTLNAGVTNLNIATNTLNAGVANLNIATNTLNTRAVNLEIATNTLNTRAGILETSTNTLNTVATLHTTQINAISNNLDGAILITREGNAGAGGLNLGYSNLCYLTGGSWSNANASTNVTSSGLLGIARGSPLATHGMLLNGICTNVWGFTAGQILYVGVNNNQITATRPTGTNQVVRIVGYAINSTSIYFNPSRTYIEILGE